jgi:hypothetical protein
MDHDYGVMECPSFTSAIGGSGILTRMVASASIREKPLPFPSSLPSKTNNGSRKSLRNRSLASCGGTVPVSRLWHVNRPVGVQIPTHVRMHSLERLISAHFFTCGRRVHRAERSIKRPRARMGVCDAPERENGRIVNAGSPEATSPARFSLRCSDRIPIRQLLPRSRRFLRPCLRLQVHRSQRPLLHFLQRSTPSFSLIFVSRGNAASQTCA